MTANKNRLAALGICLGLLLAPFGVALADTVVVRPGDTIAKIAERELGDKSRFPEICALNQRVLNYGCDVISVGMILTLPSQGANSKVAAKTVVPVRKDAGKKTVLSGDFVAQFSRVGGQALNASNGYKVQQDDDAMRISGHVVNAPADGIPGIWFKVPSSIEQRASGNTILVKALVRAPTPGPVALAYSRNEIGSSGWITKGAGTRFRTLTFTYKVPPTNNFGGDYVGILPDPRNARQFVEVAEIALTVLGDNVSPTGVELARPAEYWKFDKNAEGFSAANGTVTWQPEGHVEVAATATDIRFRSPGGLKIDGGENPVVSARIRVTRYWGSRPGWEGRIYYATTAHGTSVNYFKAIPEPSLALNEWTILRWDMSDLTEGGTDWVDSTITVFRIDLQHSGSAPHGTVDVDWVKVGSD